jgi:hypothetical protein
MHRVTRGKIVRNEDGDLVTYEEGDTFDPTDAELSAFGDRLEAESEGETPGGNGPETPLELDELTVSDVEDALATGEYDDQLDMIEEAADRVGVQEAVEDRRE